MTWNLKLIPLLTTSVLFVNWAALLGVDDHRVVLKIDKKITIAPAGTPKRGMMSMVRHPKGTIYLNFQAEPPKLYKSSDNGETWVGAPVELAQPHQVVQGVGVNHRGRLLLVHQSERNLDYVQHSLDIGGLQKERLNPVLIVYSVSEYK